MAQLESDPVKNSVGAGLDSSSSVLFSKTTLNTINTLDDEDDTHDTDWSGCYDSLHTTVKKAQTPQPLPH